MPTPTRPSIADTDKARWLRDSVKLVLREMELDDPGHHPQVSYT